MTEQAKRILVAEDDPGMQELLTGVKYAMQPWCDAVFLCDFFYEIPVQ